MYEATATEYAALEKARELWGRTWKYRLSSAWEMGVYPTALKHYKAELQELRNKCGPTWLYKFKFEA